VTIGPPQQLGLQMMSRAFRRFAQVAAYVCVAGAALEIVGYQSEEPALVLWPALVPLIVMAAALALPWKRTGSHSVVLLLIGGMSLYCFGLIVLTQHPALSASSAVPLSFLKVALILAGGSGSTARSSILWCTAGFAVAEAAAIAAAAQTGALIRPDSASILVEVGLVLMFVTIGRTASRFLRARPQLDRAAIDEEVSAMRYRIEVKAAALMHDTVLGHLAAVAGAAHGELRPELRRQIERDLEVLLGEEWLSDPSPELDSQTRSEWRQSGLLAAVQQARELSLSIEVTGDLGAVGRLSPERDAAVGLAVKQCLVNVARHAEVGHAEVVVIGAEDEVSIMVIDAGRGFSEALVASDRLGLRQSVHSRIEAVGGGVRIWSTPGRGTSVMIRVPASAPLVGPSEAPHD
jgi:signal transduction histidine kinase